MDGKWVAAVAAVAAFASAAPPAERLHAVDTKLCGFPLDVTVERERGSDTFDDAAVWTLGSTRIRLRNRTTGRAATLRAAGETWIEKASGTIRFFGHNVWLAPRNHVPYLSTQGGGTLAAPRFVLE